MMFKHLIYFWLFLNCATTIPKAYAYKCGLPEKCRLERVFSTFNPNKNEKDLMKGMAIMCDINNEDFEFKFQESFPLAQYLNKSKEKCDNQSDLMVRLSKERENNTNSIIFRWTNDNVIFDKRLNVTNMLIYILYLKKLMHVKLWGVNGFDVNIMDYLPKHFLIQMIILSKCRIQFYHNKKRINSCQDILMLNSTIRSIFQIRLDLINKSDIYNGFILDDVDFKHKICPLLFHNAKSKSIMITDLVDTFYKKNVLSFSNETYANLNSNISNIHLHKAHCINLDLNLLHPSVFKYLKKLLISSGSLNSIDGEIFKRLKELIAIGIDPIILRKINHKQGIAWIRKINHNMNIQTIRNKNTQSIKHIILENKITKQRDRMSEIFPDKDFCIYVDFPFIQFILIYEKIYPNVAVKIDIEKELTCTYLWLAQVYEDYYKYYHKYLYITNIYELTNDLFRVINTTAFKSSMSKCNYNQRISLCNKTKYQIRDIWDRSDFFILNIKLQTAFKILLYPTAFLGLITNFIVVFVILEKHNRDLFKEYKQYSYLYLNSMFCIFISVIEILSWMTECFYPFEVFCPEIRKLVAIQLFKIILKECLVTLLRFMCNFSYVAFALNRIGLIGKDHGKIVTFMCELGIKKYIGLTLLISASFSWIKYFKFEINFFYDYLNFPISNEMDIIMSESDQLNDAYFIFNSICDLFNYFVFVIICLIIDICMVVQLRRTLEEQTKKVSESMNQKQNESKKAENEKAVNKAIKMVVLNSAIGILFKLPLSFIPLLNMCAEFYYKNKQYKFKDPNFGEFYSLLLDSGTYSLIQDVSTLLFTLSISIQLFIYNRFDKKFRTGYERIKEKIFSRDKKT